MTNSELYEAITEHWGERCAEYDPGCFCCRAWDQFDAVDELQKRLGEVPSENLLRNYKRAAHDIGDLFCWCVANLYLFPPAPGEKPWLEGIKDRLKTGHEADSRIVDELKAMKLRVEAAEVKLAAVKEIVQRKMTAPVHARDDHSGCDWCEVWKIVKADAAIAAGEGERE